jgi:hypothetical protein
MIGLPDPSALEEVSNEDLLSLIAALRTETRLLRAQMEPADKRRRRMRNLILSASAFFGGLIAAPIAGPASAIFTALGIAPLINSIEEDSRRDNLDRLLRTQHRRIVDYLPVLERELSRRGLS